MLELRPVGEVGLAPWLGAAGLLLLLLDRLLLVLGGGGWLKGRRAAPDE